MSTPAQKQELIDKVKALVTAQFNGDYVGAFNHYSHAGAMDRSEVESLLEDADVGNRLTRGAWAGAIVHELDTNHDGMISLQELLAAINP